MKKSIVTKALIVLGVFLFIGNISVAQQFKYIGAMKCKMCHNKPDKGAQYDTWLAGPHANAMKSLKGEDAENPECLRCHSTYHVIDKSLRMSIKADEGVSCEACHGPGSMYKSMSIMKDREKAIAKGLLVPTEEMCRKCHNEESPDFKGFNYKEYLAKIAHDDPTTE